MIQDAIKRQEEYLIETQNHIKNKETMLKDLRWEQQKIQRQQLYMLRYLTCDELDYIEYREKEIPREIEYIEKLLVSLKEWINEINDIIVCFKRLQNSRCITPDPIL